MKAIFTTLLAIGCMGVLLWGNFHWNQKTTVSGKSYESPVVLETKKVEEKSTPSEHLLELTKNWPEQGIEGFKKALEEKRPYKVLLAGSEALGDGQSGWAAQTEAQLLEAYGEEYIDVEVYVFDRTSQEFVNGDDSKVIAEEQADMILFEPFTLKDNGKVAIQDSLKNIQLAMDDAHEANPETVFILMPPHPIYNATFYPRQVDALKDFAEAIGIAYLDHWEAWPDPKSVEIKEYITADSSQPNEQGHELWSKYVTDYLISK